jgi:hypothetical protein
MAGKVGNEQTVSRSEERDELGPVRRRPAKAVDQHERRPFAADEIAHPDTLDLGETLLEARELCVRHKWRLSCEAMSALGAPAR